MQEAIAAEEAVMAIMEVFRAAEAVVVIPEAAVIGALEVTVLFAVKTPSIMSEMAFSRMESSGPEGVAQIPIVNTAGDEESAGGIPF